MKKKTVCIALEVLAVVLIAVALVLLLRKPGKTEPTSTTPIENEAVTLPGHEELPITTGAGYAQPTDAQEVQLTTTATAGDDVTAEKTTVAAANSTATTPTKTATTTKATTSRKEPTTSTTKQTGSDNLKTENDSSDSGFGELF